MPPYPSLRTPLGSLGDLPACVLLAAVVVIGTRIGTGYQDKERTGNEDRDRDQTRDPGPRPGLGFAEVAYGSGRGEPRAEIGRGTAQATNPCWSADFSVASCCLHPGQGDACWSLRFVASPCEQLAKLSVYSVRSADLWSQSDKSCSLQHCRANFFEAFVTVRL